MYIYIYNNIHNNNNNDNNNTITNNNNNHTTNNNNNSNVATLRDLRSTAVLGTRHRPNSN